MRRLIFSLLGLFSFVVTLAQSPIYEMANCSGMPATQAMADSVKKGFRGLSVVNEKIIWISGQRGLVGKSTNGGKSFSWRRVQHYEKMDFRTLHAFDKRNAVIATAGTPASILRTSDGGKHWKEVYYSGDSAMFFDGVGFWDKNRGLIFGDPIKGIMFLAETFDGGKTWEEIPSADCPHLVEGEAAFAASGTTIRTLPNGHVYIATGGVKSRLWHSRDYGHHWEVFETPIIQGKPSQGIFSMAWKDTLNGIIVGGDYLNDTLVGGNIYRTADGGRTWIPPQTEQQGYFSCVAWNTLSDEIYAVGPNRIHFTSLKQYGDFWSMIISSWEFEEVPPGFNVIVFWNDDRNYYRFFLGSRVQLFEVYKNGYIQVKGLSN